MDGNPYALRSKRRRLATLCDVASTLGLGELIIKHMPLPERVRLRGSCRTFKPLVDASLRTLQKISDEDLAGLEWGRHAEGEALRWLAGKCPNLQVLDLGHPGSWPPRYQRWWKLPIADAVITHVAARCRQLRSLHLHGCKSVGDDALHAVAANCGELQHLDVGCCPSITDAGVSAVAAGCQQLEHLNVSHTKVRNAGMSAIATHCPRLRYLDMHRTSVADEGLMAIAQGCPELRALDVSVCRAINTDSIFAVAQNCPRLETLDYAFCGREDDPVAMAAILSRCDQLRRLYLGDAVADGNVQLGPASYRQLRSLRVDSPRLTENMAISIASRCSLLVSLCIRLDPAASDAILAAFAARCPLLEELELELKLTWCERGPSHEDDDDDDDGSEPIEAGTGVMDAGIGAVSSHWPQLRILRVSGCDRVTDGSVAELVRNCPALRTLKLSASHAGHCTVLAAGTHCPELHHLDIADLKEGAHVRDDALNCVLRNCLKLETLTLENCQGLSDAAIAMVGSGCKHLRELYVVASGGFTPQGLAALAPNLGALEVLHVWDCDALSDDTVAALANHCPRLRVVIMNASAVGDRGIVPLATQCPLLEKVWVDGCSGVTDASMIALGDHCRRLDELDVHNCTGVTRRGARAVAKKCKGLRVLNVAGCGVTPEEMEALQDRCPHVNVVWVAIFYPFIPRTRRNPSCAKNHEFRSHWHTQGDQGNRDK
eukprot:jgi/Mesvir1/4176/Mv17197-RA.1